MNFIPERDDSHPTRIMIMNGGEPLPGCPLSWDVAHSWEDKANEGKEEFTSPLWRFDCGFKLDYDGPIVSASSRFYPPKTHYGPKWNGNVTVNVLGKEVAKKEFKTDTLDQLREQAEEYVAAIGKDLLQAMEARK